jgi:hypothetical protein
VTYPTHLKRGTGKYTGATGDFNSIGEADLVSGQSVMRYFGKICFVGGGLRVGKSDQAHTDSGWLPIALCEENYP